MFNSIDLLHYRGYILVFTAVVTAVVCLIRYLFCRMQEKKAGDFYTAGELRRFEKHLTRCFGPCRSVWHEMLSSGHHIDIFLIEPTAQYPCWRLFSCGAGLRRMQLPDALKGKISDRIELMMVLPESWDPDEALAGSDCWQTSLLKGVAVTIRQESSFFGWGHTVEWDFSEINPGMTGIVMLYPEKYPRAASSVELSYIRSVQFMQIYPLYQDEINYKLTRGVAGLEELMGDTLYSPVDMTRKNAASSL